MAYHYQQEESIIEIAGIIILTILSAFFSSSETAFSSVNLIRLSSYAESGDKRAIKALHIAQNFDRTITAILIGNNIVNIAAASLATILFTNWLGPSGVGVSTIALTIIILIFGEIIPKSLAKENAEALCLAFGGILHALIVLLTPLIFVFGGIRKFMAKIVRKNGGSEPMVTEQELMTIIDHIETEGVLEDNERTLVKNALEFDETTLDEILVPRVDIIAVSANENVEQIKDIFLTEQYSRLPVYDKTIDNIIGIIHQKDFFKLYIEGELSIAPIIQNTVYLHELMKISDAFAQMQRQKLHMAVVTDQYGGTEGLVTLEDILEELVGEIWDENDEIITQIIPVELNKYQVSCELSLSNMLEELSLPDELIDSDHHSVGGWVLELFGHIPEVGETITQDIFTITVTEISEQRVVKILLEITPPKSDEAEQDA